MTMMTFTLNYEFILSKQKHFRVVILKFQNRQNTLCITKWSKQKRKHSAWHISRGEPQVAHVHDHNSLSTGKWLITLTLL